MRAFKLMNIQNNFCAFNSAKLITVQQQYTKNKKEL